MQLNQLGNTDLCVSELALGTMTFGQQNSLEESLKLLDLAKDQGINFFDTAEMYPVPVSSQTQGLSESFLGKWLSQQQRDQSIIATKMIGPGRGLSWIRPNSQSISADSICSAVDNSLQRLQTDYIDLYQIHWPDRYVPIFGQTVYDPLQERETVPLVEQLQTFADIVKSGKIRYLGLSNETPWGLYCFCQLAQQLRLPHVVSMQNAYSLLNRTFEFDLVEVCYRNRISLLAYSPLAFGLLSGKYLNSRPSAARLALFQEFGGRYYKPNVDKAVIAYTEIANRYSISPAQLALAFTRQKWFVTSTIIGATRLEQLQQNIDSLSVVLSKEVLAAIETIHLQYPNPAP